MSAVAAAFTTATGCKVIVTPEEITGEPGVTEIVWRVDDGKVGEGVLDGETYATFRSASLRITDEERVALILALGGTA